MRNAWFSALFLAASLGLPGFLAFGAISDAKTMKPVSPVQEIEKPKLKNAPLNYKMPTKKKVEYPVAVQKLSEICAGEKFYDGEGKLQVGTRACNPQPCIEVGQTNFITNKAFPAKGISQ